MAQVWELLATRSGGSVTSLVSANGVLVAATPAGLRRSIDSGHTWTPVGGAPSPALEVVALSPSFVSSGVALAGTAAGLQRSATGGRSWQAVLVGSRVLAIAFVDDQRVLVGTESDGILRSDDAGQSWKSANPGLLDLTVLGLSCSETVATDGTLFAATASGLFRSRNTGRSWESVDTLPGEPAVQCVALSPHFATDGVVLAGTEGDGLLRSTDAGATWHSADALTGRSVTALAWTAAAEQVAAGTEIGVAVSIDAGGSWRWYGPQSGPILSVAFAPDGALLAGLPSRGVVRTDDRGQWQPANTGLCANLVVALAIATDGTLYTGGLEDGLAASRDTGKTWQPANVGAPDGTAVFGLTADSGSGDVYAATSAGVLKYGSGAWRRVHPDPVRAIVVLGQRVLAADAAGGLRVSQDGGSTWRSLDVPLGARPATAVAIGAPSVMLVGGLRGVWRSADGRDWRQLLGLQDAGVAVTGLSASPAYEQDRMLLVATSMGVYASPDAGASFHAWSEGLGETPVVAVAFSPSYAEDRQVYAVELGGRIWRRQSV